MNEIGQDSNESRRQTALRLYGIMDTELEKDYDEITRMASSICNTPVALVSIVDNKKQWFKSRQGIDITETLAEHAFPQQPGVTPTVIRDLRADSNYTKNPLVAGAPHFVFYAGAPIVTDDGLTLGSLCVLDYKPKELNDGQLLSLRSLANQLVALFELHRKNKELQQLREQLDHKNKELQQFAHVVSHDIKTPVSNILLSSQLLREDYAEQLDKNAGNLLDILKRASAKIKDLVDGVLSYYKSDAALSQPKEEIELSGFFNAIVEILAPTPNIFISFPRDKKYIYAGRTVLEQIFLNLLNNGIKYNDAENVDISIGFSETQDRYCFEVKDNGRGISEKNRERIFSLFTNGGEKDRFGNSGTGIGLSIVKKLVESLGGSVEVESATGSGTIIRFTIEKEN